jgi:hypothetical protein
MAAIAVSPAGSSTSKGVGPIDRTTGGQSARVNWSISEEELLDQEPFTMMPQITPLVASKLPAFIARTRAPIRPYIPKSRYRRACTDESEATHP